MQHNSFVDRQHNGVTTQGTERDAAISMKRSKTSIQELSGNPEIPYLKRSMLYFPLQKLYIYDTRSLGALRAPTTSWLG